MDNFTVRSDTNPTVTQGPDDKFEDVVQVT